MRKDDEFLEVGQDEGPQDQENNLEEWENQEKDDKKFELTQETEIEHNESREPAQEESVEKKTMEFSWKE